MKRLLATLIAVLCVATASAQTIKSLGYNTTNGQIVAATNVVWTNSFTFSTNTVAAQVRTNLGLGWSALTNTNAVNFFAATLVSYSLIQSAIQDDSTEARNDLGLSLPALTNTSNVTMMRALAGSTNTNQPFSGTISFPDANNDDQTITISNGIIVNWTP
jgi:hypothetical protein